MFVIIPFPIDSNHHTITVNLDENDEISAYFGAWVSFTYTGITLKQMYSSPSTYPKYCCLMFSGTSLSSYSGKCGFVSSDDHGQIILS